MLIFRLRQKNLPTNEEVGGNLRAGVCPCKFDIERMAQYNSHIKVCKTAGYLIAFSIEPRLCMVLRALLFYQNESLHRLRGPPLLQSTSSRYQIKDLGAHFPLTREETGTVHDGTVKTVPYVQRMKWNQACREQACLFRL